MDWMISIGSLTLGLILLGVGGDWLVRGSSTLARLFGMTPAIVGVTVVSAGTSAPELAVSIQAALTGSADIAVGNVVGSNIINIAVVLGLTALFRPIVADRSLALFDTTLMFASTVALIAVSQQGSIGRVFGVICIVTLLAYIAFNVIQTRRHPTTSDSSDLPTQTFHRWIVPPALCVIGVALLTLGGHLVVEGASDIARAWGISERAIGLSIVALGTSLPELAATVVAMMRRLEDLALGNIIGSNIFNILGILGLTAAITPLTISPTIASTDVWVMGGYALALMILLPWRRRLGRTGGGLFLGGVMAYYIGMFLTM